jgi:GMP synthase (glutamine-hydrolysing)
MVSPFTYLKTEKMITTIKNSNDQTLQQIKKEMELRKTKELFLFFPLGSQTDHLIAQQIAKQRVFCLPADPTTITANDVLKLKPKGIFLSGSPASVYDGNVQFDTDIFELGIPVLGICYGAQLIAKHVGLEVAPATHREYGSHEFNLLDIGRESPLFKNIPNRFVVI